LPTSASSYLRGVPWRLHWSRSSTSANVCCWWRLVWHSEHSANIYYWRTVWYRTFSATICERRRIVWTFSGNEHYRIARQRESPTNIYQFWGTVWYGTFSAAVLECRRIVWTGSAYIYWWVWYRESVLGLVAISTLYRWWRVILNPRVSTHLAKHHCCFSTIHFLCHGYARNATYLDSKPICALSVAVINTKRGRVSDIVTSLDTHGDEQFSYCVPTISATTAYNNSVLPLLGPPTIVT
jgi:hypothetical protein